MPTDIATHTIFHGLTSASPLNDLHCAAVRAGHASARSDVAADPAIVTSDAATVAYLRDPATYDALVSWLGSYRHDEQVLAALATVTGEDGRDALAEILASAWLAYGTVVMQARDAAREAARRA